MQNLPFAESNKKIAKLGVLGASGFSREVADICLDLEYNKLVFIDLNPKQNSYFGFTLLDEKMITHLVEDEYHFVLGIGDNKLRKKVYEKYKYLKYPNIIHPSASMGLNQFKQGQKKKGNIITAGVRLTNNIQMGDFGIFNLNCTVGHDCILKNFINISPGANISGNVLLSEGSYIGTNAAILQGSSIEEKIVIGRFSTVGAGAVVTKSVPDYTTVVGIPAKQIKKQKK